MWTKDKIHAMLDKRPEAVMRALIAIDGRQEPDERASGTTRHTNGVGWSKYDAEFCGQMADRARRNWSFSPKQLAVSRNKVKRYWRQLIEIANAREAAVTPTVERAEPELVDDFVDVEAEMLNLGPAQGLSPERAAALVAVRDELAGAWA